MICLITGIASQNGVIKYKRLISHIISVEIIVTVVMQEIMKTKTIDVYKIMWEQSCFDSKLNYH